MSGALAAPAGSGQTVRFAIYDQESGGTLLWEEVQHVTTDANGQYSVLLGGTHTDGLPVHLFAGGAARWLSVQGGPRTLLTAVPFAVAAATASDASSLAGRPAVDYALTPAARRKDAESGLPVGAEPDPSTPPLTSGTIGRIGKFVTNIDLGDSIMFENAGRIGFNTTSPLDTVHSQFTDGTGGTTGIAVRNLANTATSYSGMLFYDHTGALRQFQGYNNNNGEYRINNISPTGTINFMIGSSSQFRVMTNGDIGLGAGTNTPDVKLHMFSSGIDGVTVRGSRHRGTIAAPTVVLSGDSLARFEGSGYNGSVFAQERAMIRMAAAENWSTTANGTAMEFYTTTNGTTVQTRRVLIEEDGQVGINATPGVWNVNAAVKNGIDFAAAPGETFAVANIDGSSAGYLTLNGGSFAGMWLSRGGVNKWRVLNNSSDQFQIGDDGGTIRLQITQAGASTFTGNMTVNGTFTASGAKAFTIDHPFDPGKTLSHAAVESPEVINLYRGNVTTDASGKAVVQLPAYYAAINRDPSYFLTVVGVFAQAIISREISDNSFEIATSVPNVKVSWEVKATRDDLYMREHPFEVEKVKPTTLESAVSPTGATGSIPPKF